MIAGWLALSAAWAGPLQVSVVSEAGAPLSNVSLSATNAAGELVSARTDALGEAELVLGAGGWRVLGAPPGGASQVARYVGNTPEYCEAELLEVGESGAEAVLILPEGGAVTALLVDDASGAALSQVVLRGRASSSWPVSRTATSGADGEVRLTGLDPAVQYSLEISGSSLPSQTLAMGVQVGAGETAALGEQPLWAGLSMQGLVSGPDGPVAGATVVAITGSGVRSTLSGEDGRFVLAGLPEGEALLRASAPGLATTWWPDRATPGERVPNDAVDVGLSLEAEAGLRGRFAISEGDVDLVVSSVDRLVSLSAQVAEDGSFEVLGLPAVPMTVMVYGDGAGLVTGPLRDSAGAERVFELEAGVVQELGTVPMPREAVITGVVVGDADGAPVAGAVVLVRVVGTADVRQAMTNSAGEFRAGGLPAGTYKLSVGRTKSCPNERGFVSVYYADAVDQRLESAVRLGEGESAEWAVRLPPDEDEDEMDDRWEAEYGLDPAVDDSGEDPDGDGYTNLEEYRLGTDPLSEVEAEGCGCGTSGGARGLWLGVAGLLSMRRRRRLS